MPGSILATRIRVPPQRESLVRRPRLTEQLTDGMSGRLTLVCAPAGYGKTTMVSEWVVESGTTGIVWLSLDASDSSLEGFLGQLIASFQVGLGAGDSFGTEALGMLGGISRETATPALTSLINELAGLDGKLVLVLEDYHLVDSADVDAALSYLIEHMPETLHIVVTSRSDPALPIARYRARNALTEVRARDLRFTVTEATTFLNETMGLGLRDETVAALERRTEGWIAGLQLAALSMKRSDDREAAAAAFAGSHRFILDYLVEEVLGRQTDAIQEFLVSTSILDRLCGPLCDAITGGADAQSVLESLERDNLFVVPLDDQRYWYRYHHLFRDLLARRLDHLETGTLDALHERAIDWFVQNGHAGEAIDHAMRFGMDRWAAEIIEREVEPMWKSGDLPRLRHLTRKLSDEAANAGPMVCGIRGYSLISAGKISDGMHYLDRAEELSQDQTTLEEFDHDQKRVRGRVLSLRAMSCTLSGDLEGVRRYGEAALEILPDRDPIWRGLAAMSLGDLHTFAGDMKSAIKARMQTVRQYEASGNSYYTMVANTRLAATLRELGRLREAVELGRRQLDAVETGGPAHAGMAGQLRGIVADAMLELNNPEEALSLAEDGLDVCRLSGSLTLLGIGYASLTRVRLSIGDLDGADALLREARVRLGDADQLSWAVRNVAALEVRLWIRRGEIDRAVAWLEERALLGTPDPPDYLGLIDRIATARVLIAQNRTEESVELLGLLHAFARANELVSRDIEILVLTALAKSEHGDQDEAVAILGDALVPAGEGGFVRTFVDEGPPMARLLYETVSQNNSSAYLRSLLSAFPSQETVAASQPGITEANEDLFEPLSERELDVLRLMAEGLSNQEIGERLFVSTHTVKTHARNLFAKLDAHSRTAAVNKARGLGLVPTV